MLIAGVVIAGGIKVLKGKVEKPKFAKFFAHVLAGYVALVRDNRGEQIQ
jgi:hypothetical protein